MRATKNPGQVLCILDTYFYRLVEDVNRTMNEIPSLGDKEKLMIEKSFFKYYCDKKNVKCLIRYVDGNSPELGKCWKGCRFLYILCCLVDHWVSLKVDMKARLIEIYDSFSSRRRNSKLQSLILPKLIRSEIDENYKLKCFDVKNVSCPQQENG